MSRKKRRKRKLKKGVKVIFGILLIIIFIGGGYIYMINNNSSDKLEKDAIDKDNSKDDVVETVDDIDTNQDNDSKDVVEDDVELAKAPVNNGEFSNLQDGEYETTNGHVLKIENGISYVDGYLIVNKTYRLSDSYKTQNPYQAVTGDWCVNCIDKDTMESFKLMQSDAASLGLNIYIASGYRGYNNQRTLYNNYVARDGKDAADTYSARPGHSEHQTGLCFDLNSVNDSFSYTDEGKWVNNNAHLYGFIIRYPKGKESITGYQYESWHLRYVGKELALELYNNGNWITMEEYFGLSSSY